MGAEMGIIPRNPNRTLDSSDNILGCNGEKAAKAGSQRIQATLETSIPGKVGIFWRAVGGLNRPMRTSVGTSVYFSNHFLTFCGMCSCFRGFESHPRTNFMRDATRRLQL